MKAEDKTKIKSIAFIGVLLAFAVSVGYFERLIPPVIASVPGIKLGLPNIAVIILLYVKDYKTAFILNILRVIISGLLFTGIWGIFYGLSGALVSFGVMSGLKKTGKFGVAGVSAAGGVSHNLGQIFLAVLIVNNIKLFYYFPVLIISGIFAGLVTGYISGIIIIRLGKINHESLF